MKGQVSIEFVTLLSLVLLASSILISNLTDKADELEKTEAAIEAEKLAMETNYRIKQAEARKNSSISLTYPQNLQNNYIIQINNRSTQVYNDGRETIIASTYNGPEKFQLRTSNSYTIKYEDGVHIE